jgi:hypothetical protein
MGPTRPPKAIAHWHKRKVWSEDFALREPFFGKPNHSAQCGRPESFVGRTRPWPNRPWGEGWRERHKVYFEGFDRLSVHCLYPMSTSLFPNSKQPRAPPANPIPPYFFSMQILKWRGGAARARTGWSGKDPRAIRGQDRPARDCAEHPRNVRFGNWVPSVPGFPIVGQRRAHRNSPNPMVKRDVVGGRLAGGPHGNLAMRVSL